MKKIINIFFSFVLSLFLTVPIQAADINGDISMEAKDFTITVLAAQSLTEDDVFGPQYADVKIVNQMTRQNLMPFIHVNEQELKQINDTQQPGIFMLTIFLDESSGISLTTTVEVTVINEVSNKTNLKLLKEVGLFGVGVVLIGIGIFLIRTKKNVLTKNS